MAKIIVDSFVEDMDQQLAESDFPYQVVEEYGDEINGEDGMWSVFEEITNLKVEIRDKILGNVPEMLRNT